MSRSERYIPPSDEQLEQWRQAKAAAKRCDDEREFDSRAYDAVQHGLSQLIHQGGIEEAKALGLTLMQKGSYQIECSDEGLMQEEIEDCLRLVIAAAAGTPSGSEWARNMLRQDSSRCICRPELAELAGSHD